VASRDRPTGQGLVKELGRGLRALMQTGSQRGFAPTNQESRRGHLKQEPADRKNQPLTHTGRFIERRVGGEIGGLLGLRCAQERTPTNDV